MGLARPKSDRVIKKKLKTTPIAKVRKSAMSKKVVAPKTIRTKAPGTKDRHNAFLLRPWITEEMMIACRPHYLLTGRMKKWKLDGADALHNPELSNTEYARLNTSLIDQGKAPFVDKTKPRNPNYLAVRKMHSDRKDALRVIAVKKALDRQQRKATEAAAKAAKHAAREAKKKVKEAEAIVKAARKAAREDKKKAKEAGKAASGRGAAGIAKKKAEQGVKAAAVRGAGSVAKKATQGGKANAGRGDGRVDMGMLGDTLESMTRDQLEKFMIDAQEILNRKRGAEAENRMQVDEDEHNME